MNRSPFTPARAARGLRHRVRLIPLALAGVVAALLVTFGFASEARAVPSFARKYQTSCSTCHTVFPYLNAFGEAFRRDGFRFPSKNGSLDSDVIKAELLPLGQDEYKKMFPDAVWPSRINQAVPIGLVANAGVAVNLPNSDAHDAADNTFAWNDMVGEIAVFAAGQFNDSLTYFTELSVEGDGIGIERAYLLWNDIVGPPHAFNLSVGRILPTLHSFGPHSSYLSDLFLPSVATGQLYNPTAPEDPLAMAYGHPDGVELNGVISHRIDYSLGWVASTVAEVDGLSTPSSQDAYAHLGIKVGGVTLDGEGIHSVDIIDPKRPWEETALTLDAFGYHGLARLDDTTDPTGPTPQDDKVNVIGGDLRGQLGSLTLTAGGYGELHSQPYAGVPGDPTAVPPVAPIEDTTKATAMVGFGELSYVVYPWLVPAVRAELTQIDVKSDNYPDSGGPNGKGSLLRVVPGVSTLLRPNLKFVLACELNMAKGTPPTGAWDPTGSAIGPQPPGKSKFEAERVLASLSFGF